MSDLSILDSSVLRYAALLIDMQPYYLGFYGREAQEGLFSAQRKVIQLCAQESIPVVVLEVKTGGFGKGKTVACLQREIDLVPLHLVLTKSTNDGFCNASLDEQLQLWNTTDLLAMGINASACVKDTCLTGLAKGYRIHTARDCIADPFVCATSFDWYELNSTLYQNSSQLIECAKKSLEHPTLESRVEQ